MKLVAVYGSLKRGYGNYPTMERAKGKFITEAVSNFKVVMDGHAYPYINIDNNGYKLSVELFEVNEDGLKVLDSLEGHPTFYKREVKTFTGADGNQYEAWVYILQDFVEHNEELLKGEVYVW